MRVVVVAEPKPVVSVQLAKTHLGVDHDAWDELIEAMVAAATATIDGPNGWLGRAIGLQTLELYLPSLGVASIGLPYPPAVEVEQVEYVDAAGATVSLASNAYELRGQLLRPVWSSQWPQAAWRDGAETVSIRYRAGYEKLPAPIRAAILLMVGDLFRNRGEVALGSPVAVIPMTPSVANLLQPFRVYA